MESNTITTLCSNNPHREGYLYLPGDWARSPWIGISKNVSVMPEFPFWEYQRGVGRLYIIKQGSIWRPRGTRSDVLWRIMDNVHPFLYDINNDGLWQSSRTGKLLLAEKVTFDQLLLEELFL